MMILSNYLDICLHLLALQDEATHIHSLMLPGDNDARIDIVFGTTMVDLIENICMYITLIPSNSVRQLSFEQLKKRKNRQSMNVISIRCDCIGN